MLTVLCSFIFFYGFTAADIKKILDGVQYDITNHQKWSLSDLLKPNAEVDNTDVKFDTSWYYTKTEFNNCFITHVFK